MDRLEQIKLAHGDCKQHIETAGCWFISEVESLRQELAVLGDKHHATVLNYIVADKERVLLRQQLAAKDTEKGVRDEKEVVNFRMVYFFH